MSQAIQFGLQYAVLIAISKVFFERGVVHCANDVVDQLINFQSYRCTCSYSATRQWLYTKVREAQPTAKTLGSEQSTSERRWSTLCGGLLKTLVSHLLLQVDQRNYSIAPAQWRSQSRSQTLLQRGVWGRAYGEAGVSRRPQPRKEAQSE